MPQTGKDSFARLYARCPGDSHSRVSRCRAVKSTNRTPTAGETGRAATVRVGGSSGKKTPEGPDKKTISWTRRCRTASPTGRRRLREKRPLQRPHRIAGRGARLRLVLRPPPRTSRRRRGRLGSARHRGGGEGRPLPPAGTRDGAPRAGLATVHRPRRRGGDFLRSAAPSAGRDGPTFRDALDGLPSSSASGLVSALAGLVGHRTELSDLLPATQDGTANEEAMGLPFPDLEGGGAARCAMTLNRLSLTSGRLYATLLGTRGRGDQAPSTPGRCRRCPPS
ncbi:hypothetical protein THAOC_03465 [Thalassiosira oceanica]|uniref:Uncharacterized protein n=1 Tax=Thalassiosira oceanica TaxID=159749 RepID=K0TKX4_THAOC|nr:hypothetical protein THAOC_03465 [Thalassiosira oceanica]|eukprot:EJK74836.1 hypothetical protein THAOC_03465 [Thalassiosira oceanica]